MKHIFKNSDFDLFLDNFCISNNRKIHRDATARLAEIIGAKKKYLQAVKTGDFNLVALFMNMDEASGNKLFSRVDRKAMAKMAKLANDAYEDKDCRQVAVLAEGLVFSHLVDYLKLEKRADFYNLTDQDLFSKEILPPEIFFQYFILQLLAKYKKFDWKREEKIIDQTFIFAGICFADIYEHIALF